MVRQPLKDAIDFIITYGPANLTKHRADFLSRISRRAQALEEEEKKLHTSMHPSGRAVMKGKRLVILKELLDEISYPDTELIKDIAAGFKLTGEHT